MQIMIMMIFKLRSLPTTHGSKTKLLVKFVENAENVSQPTTTDGWARFNSSWTTLTMAKTWDSIQFEWPAEIWRWLGLLVNESLTCVPIFVESVSTFLFSLYLLSFFVWRIYTEKSSNDNTVIIKPYYSRSAVILW